MSLNETCEYLESYKGFTVLCTDLVGGFLILLLPSYYNMHIYTVLLGLKPYFIETMVSMHCTYDGQKTYTAVCNLE